MAKYTTYFCFVFLLTSCNFFSKKPEDTTADIAENLQFVKSDTIPYEIEENYTDLNALEGLTEIHFTELWIWDYLNEDREWEEI